MIIILVIHISALKMVCAKYEKFIDKIQTLERLAIHNMQALETVITDNMQALN